MAFTTSELISYILAGDNPVVELETEEEVKRFRNTFRVTKSNENKKMKAYGKAFELPQISLIVTEQETGPRFTITFQESKRGQLNIKFIGVQDG
jgi:hypothetical protein